MIATLTHESLRRLVSISYRIDRERGLACVVWDGLVTAEVFLNHAQRLVADPDWPSGRHLSDLRTAVVDASIDESVLQKAADLFGSHPSLSNLRVAVVAGDAFEKAGVFERYLLRYRPFFFVFNSLNPACTWLGLDAREIEATLGVIRLELRKGLL